MQPNDGKGSPSESADFRTRGLRKLFDLGGHLFAFTVTRDPDDPLKKVYGLRPGWQTERDDWATIEAARHVGLIVGSLELSVVDVDVHEFEQESIRKLKCTERVRAIGERAGITPCFYSTPSGGAHLFYKRKAAHGKRSVGGLIDGMKVEVFGDTGFVELYGPQVLADWIDELPEFGAHELLTAEPAPAPKPVQAPGQPLPLTGGARRGVIEGDRNSGAFVRARCATENDVFPELAVRRAQHDAERAGLSPAEAAKASGQGVKYGAAKRSVAPVRAIFEIPQPDPAPEPKAPDEDAKAVLEAWSGQESKQPMPAPSLPETLPGEIPLRYQSPVDSWELACHWTQTLGGLWRCEIGKPNPSGNASLRWLRFIEDTGWRPHSRDYAVNALRVHGRAHYYTWVEGAKNEEGGFVENPHAGSSNTIVKPAEEAARTMQGVALAQGVMDADPFYTGLPQGRVVDARARLIVQARPELMVSKQAGAEPGPWINGEFDRMVRYHVPCPIERMWLACYVGRAFLGGRDRLALFLPGAKLTAKTTIIEALRSAFGDDYAMTVDVATLTGGKGGGSVHTRDSTKAQMHGMRLITLSEGEEGATLSTKAIKQLISDDRITGRLMAGGNTVQIDPSWNFLFGFNTDDFPTLDYTDDAAWDRVVVLGLDVIVPPERRIEGFIRILQQTENLSGVVGWLLHHGRLWADHGMPPMSQRMIAAALRLREESKPPLQRFLDEYTARDPKAATLFGHVRQGFVEWCRDQGEAIDLSSKAMGSYLRKLKGVSVRRGTDNKLTVYGLALVRGASTQGGMGAG